MKKAAHKFDSRILLGEEDYQAISMDEHIFNVDKIIIHPNYDPFNSHIHNLAILQLTNEIEVTSNVSEIGLEEGSGLNLENLIISGWGKPSNQRSHSINNIL